MGPRAAHDEAAVLHVSCTAQRGGGGRSARRRAQRGDARGGWNGPAPEYETAPAGAARPGLAASCGGAPHDLERKRLDDWFGHDALGPGARWRAPNGVRRTVAGGVADRHTALAQHGDARRQPVPRYALQLLRSELRVA